MITGKRPPHLKDLGNINKICLNCCGLLGDTLIRVPLIVAIRDKFPEAHISVIVDPGSRKAIDNHPAINEILIHYRNDKSRLLNNLQWMISIRRQHYDLMINLYSGGSSWLVSFITGARFRISFNHKRALRITHNILLPLPDFTGNWTRALGTLLIPLGISPQEIKTDTEFYCSETARRKINDFFTDNKLKFIGINLGGGAPDRRWPVGHFVDLVRIITTRYHSMPVLFTNPGQESVLAASFAQQYRGQIINPGLRPFQEEAAILERCDALLTGDTALMHLATGVKTPVFAIFLQTSPNCVRPDINPFFSCIGDNSYSTNKDGSVIHNEISVDKAADDFIAFCEETLGWEIKTRS